ncbi:ABC transporter permease [Paenibacillus riograndensis]|uniref:CUT1 family carbohydrate ABC transporter membrane protein 1 n=1 Tax=Paenibacillus riograndensis SBR5 TaxID=1073571 RepID=A0A0E4CWV4_9BACL|nr:ABC transporter permease subunit [Paenibacillus riograndensis]CQR55686.1 CUT1 family carbohydrate ABC transporter membrane protein 1 [Paenibacillus riograndensis SBR5]
MAVPLNAAKAQSRKLQAKRSSVSLKRLMSNRYLYLMLLPTVLYFLIFEYKPMYGAIIAFKDFNPFSGVAGSPWVGFKNFEKFFESYYFFRLLKNTFLMSFYSLLFIFPASLAFALLLNELRLKKLKSFLQTVSYLPHFISLIVICGMIIDFTKPGGIINSLLLGIGIISEPIQFLILPEWFRTIYVGSGMWQSLGWNSIIYLAALSGINPSLYEAAVVDGAGRWKQLTHITLPGILPTVLILLILNVGTLLNVGWDKIILLYNPGTYVTADVISTFVYRRGVMEADYSFSAAVGLFNSVINFTLLVLANRISRKTTENSLW